MDVRSADYWSGAVATSGAWSPDPAAIPPPGMANLAASGVPVTPRSMMTLDVVQTAVRVLQNAIIKMGNARGYKIGLDAQNRPYPMWLAQQPSILTNTWGDRFQFDGMARTVASLAVFQEAFWYELSYDYLQYPSALDVLNPAIMNVTVTDGAKTYTYGLGKDKKVLDPERVIHIPGVTMPGGARGLSSIDYMNVSAGLALAALDYGSRWFAQGASPSYMLTTDAKLGQDAVRAIAQKFMVDHSGLVNSHLPLIVDSGMKPQKIQSTPDEAQYLGTLEYIRSVVGAYFGLPGHLLGGANDKGNVWGKTVQEQSFQLVDYTLSGYTTRINEGLSSLLPRGTWAALNEDVILRADAAGAAQETLADRTTGKRSVNDLRNRAGLPPVEYGDNVYAPLNSNTAMPVAAVEAEGIGGPDASTDDTLDEGTPS